jgi:tetratricopeptide (TPR) repeat protein
MFVSWALPVGVAGLLFFAAAPPFANVDAEKLVKEGRYKEARQIVEKALVSNPQDIDAVIQLANIKLAFRDLNGATELAERAVAAKPHDASAHEVLADCYGEKAQREDGFFHGLKMAHSFVSEAEATLAIDPKNIHTMRNLIQYYLEAPALAGGSKTKANEMADRIGGVDQSKGYLAKAEIALHEKQNDQLEGLYTKAVQADPKSYEARIRLAGLYLGMTYRNIQKAEESANSAMQIDANRPGAYSMLAYAKALQEKWPDLDQILAHAEKAVPNDFSYYLMAARALLSTGKDDARAERYFQKYLSQEPEGNAPTLASAHWQLGLVLEKEGKLQDAIKEVNTAVTMDPKLKGAQQDLKRMKP